MFFSQLCEKCFSTELNKLAFRPEGIKPRNTPSIRIESSDWKGDLNAVVVPLVDWFVLKKISYDNRFVLLISHFSQRFIHHYSEPVSVTAICYKVKLSTCWLKYATKLLHPHDSRRSKLDELLLRFFHLILSSLCLCQVIN